MGLHGGFKPQPSLLLLRHPFAGHALGLGDLVGGLLLFHRVEKVSCGHDLCRNAARSEGEAQIERYIVINIPARVVVGLVVGFLKRCDSGGFSFVAINNQLGSRGV